MRKILYGVCGIGNGHTYRQLPIITHLAQSSKIMIFAYADSLRFLRSYFAGHEQVRVTGVAVPYYIGGRDGIDFAATAAHTAAAGIDYAAVNSRALHAASMYLGRPDLVISDYEPTCAQYAYAYKVPLITIDQQSKYLSGDFPQKLHGHTYADEVARLRMFFPAAQTRIACSFFKVPQLPDAEVVQLVPPVLRAELADIARSANRRPDEILVYLTAQAGFEQPISELVTLLGARRNLKFRLFIPKTIDTPARVPKNISVYRHGDASFAACLRTCAGIITTAGHSLISEAMYLGLPVLALPLPLYEQQMNAKIIHDNEFGCSATRLEAWSLQLFIERLPLYAVNIKNDKAVLLRGDGTKEILGLLSRHVRRSAHVAL